ncbi:MAG TPA: inositol monophosphatase family protein, partial [Puia sp.]|nr:inositol monophosphatase family protein [Puia sp.]
MATQRLTALIPDVHAVLKAMLQGDMVVTAKPDGSAVSSIDIGIQEAMVSMIRKNYPEDRIIAEESGMDVPDTGPGCYWVIDPIDGTENFIRGKREFSFSIGVM